MLLLKKKNIVLWKISLIMKLQLLHSLFLIYTPFFTFTVTLLVFLSGFTLDMWRKAYSKLTISQASHRQDCDVNSFFLSVLQLFLSYLLFLFLHWSAPPCYIYMLNIACLIMSDACFSFWKSILHQTSILIFHLVLQYCGKYLIMIK